jgi:hypothetical protein
LIDVEAIYSEIEQRIPRLCEHVNSVSKTSLKK